MFANFSTGISDFNSSFSAWLPEASPIQSELVNACSAFLDRGLPTHIHPSMQKRMNEFFGEDNLNAALSSKDRFICSALQDWSTIIKGGEHSNPALDFWNNDLRNHSLADIPLNSVFYPEVRFSSIAVLPQNGNISEAETVDFYSPVFDCVLEIDGLQHLKPAQNSKDYERNKFCKDHSIHVFRISTKELRDRTGKYEHFFNRLKELQDQKKLDEKIATEETHPVLIKVISILRLQRVFLRLLSDGLLPLDFKKWRLSLSSEQDDIHDLCQIALLDLLDLYNAFAPIFGEKKQNFDAFQSVFEVSSKPLKIDFSVSHSFDSTESTEDKIYIRNNPFTRKHHLDAVVTVADFADKSLSFGHDIDKLNVNKIKFEKLLDFTFDLPSFRPGQYRILDAALHSSSTLGLLPTGGGKSLTFQFPTVIQSGCSVVVCPISALVRDHVLELEALGFKGRAEFITQDVVGEQRKNVHRKLKQGALKFLFVSPEQFQNEEFRSVVKEACNRGTVNRFVIDEAHCISEWGHDFRISYLSLANTLRNLGERVPILCLTATASISVLRDIQIEFDLKDQDVIYEMSQSRPELTFEVKPVDNKFEILNELLKEKKDTGELNENSAAIIFYPFVNGKSGAFGNLGAVRKALSPLKVGLFTGSTPKEWLSEIEEKLFPGWKLDKKHTNNDKKYNDYKAFVQKEFKSNKISTILATKSFGMGVNKPNIRTAIHCGFASSIEALYQEAGRAGRDGQAARCVSIVNLPPELDGPILDLNADVVELQAWNDQNRSKLGDLGEQLFLFLDGTLSVRDEARRIYELFSYLRKHLSPKTIGIEGSFGFDDGKAVEKTIYRLFQLGFILDWTAKDPRKGYYEVEFSPIKSEQLYNNFLKLVKKYEANDEDFQRKIDEIETVFTSEFTTSDGYAAVFAKLAIWNKLTFFNFRRQSLLNLLTAYKEFDHEHPEAFKATLDSYFKIDKQTKSLNDAVSANITDMTDIVIDVFSDKNGRLAVSRMSEFRSAVMRLSESYPDNSAVDLAYCISNSAETSIETELTNEVERRLSRYIERLFLEADNETAHRKLLDVYQLTSSRGDTALSLELITQIDTFEFALEAYSLSKSAVSMTYILNSFNTELGEANWKKMI